MRFPLPDRIVRWVEAHPLALDVALAAALAIVSVVQGFEDTTGKWEPFGPAAAVLTVLSTAPVAFRRRAPVAVYIACSLPWIALITMGNNPVGSTYGVLLALYSVAASQPWWRTLTIFTYGSVIWIYAGILAGEYSVLSVALQSLVVPAVVWKVGDSEKQLEASHRRLAQVNEQLARDREDRARRAVVDERVRIARELHDVVAHHMSVVSVQGGLARYVLRSDPDTAGAALDTVLQTSAEALDEMRRMLALLRVDPETYEPAPSLSRLPDLLDRVRAAGVPVEIRTAGTPAVLSPGLELCAYRVIQESLTNVLKHARPATAAVSLDYGPRLFTAVIRDEGAASLPPAATGHGLNGMRERATLYGGTLTAGPHEGGGFEVRLTLPLPDDRSGEPS